MAIALSKRLSIAASFAKGSYCLADVGSDHALLPLFLLQKGWISYAQAIENKKGPFERMRQAIASSPCASKVECSFSSGLSALSPKADAVAILGMCGRLVEQILREGKDRLPALDRLILDAHRDLPFLRENLQSLGLTLLDEALLEEGGIYYDVMLLKPGVGEPINQLDIRFGPILRKKRGEVYLAYLEKEEQKCLAHLKKPLSEKRRKEIEEDLALIQGELAL